jgi:microcystin-dependent protein
MDPFLGQIVLFGGNFAPRGWALCEGQLLPISQNSALFSILGTIYGGDGRTTFALPDLRGRVPVQPGTGPGLSNYQLGQRGGAEQVTLTINEIPSHSHLATGQIKASNTPGTTNNPTGNVLSSAVTQIDRSTSVDSNIYAADNNTNVNMAADQVNITVGNAGGSRPHYNIQPFLGVNYIIALQGIFPSRN